MTRALLPLADITALGAVILAMEEGARPGLALDARIHAALGWHIRRTAGGRLLIRAPAATLWQPMPRPTRCMSDAARLVPPGWHYGLAQREAALAWCADPAAPFARFFE